MAGKNTMRRVSLRNIAAHKLRLALTVLAVVLGTAFIAGAFMFTNSLNNTFKGVVDSAYSDVDAVATPIEGSPGISEETLTALTEDSMVSNLNLTATTTVVMANEEQEPIQTGGGSSSVGIWYSSDEQVGQPLTMTDGQAPVGDDQLVINSAAAESFGISVGDSLLLVDPADRHEMTVSGIYDMELDQSSTISALVELETYQDRYSSIDMNSQVLLSAAEGASDTDLVVHLEETYQDIEVETGEQLAESISEEITQALSFINYFLVAFGLVALLVGTFLIANTFAMIVAQRTKEFALLRALGAARKQITRSVVLEAAIIGVIGSMLGVIAGVGLVAAINAFMSSRGMPLSDSGLGLSTTAVVVPIVLGTVVTVLSAWMPARRAGEILPVEAMRSSESASEQSLKVRTIFGGALILAGIASTLVAMALSDASTSNRAILVGIGAFGIVVGYFFAGPALSLPIVPRFGALIGAPFGAVGKLAATNSRRNPRRTSATAFALTLGIALVTMIGMLGDTMKNSIDDVAENSITADYILSGPSTGNFPIPGEVPDAVSSAEGVGQILTLSTAPVAVDGQTSVSFGPTGGISFVANGDLADLAVMDMQEGSSDLGDNSGVVATTDFAAANGWQVGDTVELTDPDRPGETYEGEMVGIFEPNNIFQNMVISQSLVRDFIPDTDLGITTIGVNGDDSVTGEQLRTNLEEAVKSFIVVQVVSTEEAAGQVSQAIDQMLNILYALLSLAVIIAILGIVNTLTLGVIERRQEIGMLRAVGAQRSQIRTMITLEAVQISVFGAVMGVLIGLGIGWAFLDVLSGQGLGTISVPYSLMLWVLAGSGVVGVLAAIWPANRASKTPPLDAIAD
ncbi:ABC transporter permease [Corynebacterium alimapuense]|uniref:ABC transporter permease n=1 Tax=Corynebacterium alimapuense TaxID=1576874 RepID=A0A3M8K9A4_9CORY|nr:FtsX-like permease family protein [Corynebacterium alimapuense]RNE49716.1 ABC transporter permease [Corynebacterium alimapuense]